MVVLLVLENVVIEGEQKCSKSICRDQSRLQSGIDVMS